MARTPRLLICGPLPPPKGGVSIHIERLISMLDRRGYQVSLIDEAPVRKKGVFNIRSLNIVTYFLRFWQSDVVHVHSSVDVFRIVNSLVTLLLRKRLLITLHSWRPRGGISQFLHGWIFRRASNLICVSAKIAAEVTGKSVTIRPAFIPPQMSCEPELPNTISQWIQNRTALGDSIIASNAYQLDRFEQQDIYGTDLCINMMNTLVNEQGKKAALVFNVASLAKGRSLFDHYHSRISELGLQDHILLVSEPHMSFVKLIEQSDLSIRATNTDGDALSIREGLYLNKPVVASNVVWRPDGTTLFESRNVESLVGAVGKLIDELESNISEVDLQNKDDSDDFYNNLYSGA